MTDAPRYLDYADVQLRDVPHARAVADRVVAGDRYRVRDVPEGAIVVDVGAFHGAFSVLAAVAREARVVACEPAGPSVAVLRENLVLNRVQDRVRVVEAMIGERTREDTFLYRPEEPTSSARAALLPASAIGEPSRVAVVAIGTVVEWGLLRWGKRPIFLKVSCEGSEREILGLGGRATGLDWLDAVDGVAIARDRNVYEYALLLQQRGFRIDLPEGGDVVHARRAAARTL